MSHRPHGTTRRTPTRDEERVALARLEGVRTSGTSIRIKTPSSDVGLDYNVSCDQRSPGSSMLPWLPLGDRGVFLGRQYPFPSDG